MTGASTPTHEAGGVEYTCPMHPEVRQIGPGSCPKCGMALEPSEAAGPEEGADIRELVMTTRRFWISVVLTAPLILMTMAQDLPGHLPERLASPTTSRFVELALATPVVLWGGWPVFVRAWQSLVYRSLNMFTLIGLGVTVAFVYSLVATLVPAVFPPSFHNMDGLVAVYFEAAAARGLSLLKSADFKATSGKGVTGNVDSHAVALGNLAMLQQLNVDPGPLAAQAESLRADGQTVMFVAVDAQPAGLLTVADPIKSTTVEAIRHLHAEGLKIVMLTGDNATTAQAVARQLGIDDVVADVLPDQKADAVKRLQADGRFVAMAGDGVNDAPALAQAQVGIAMGTGTDVAMESAGVTLVKGDLTGIVRARRLSRATMANIKQNLFFAFAYNALGVPLAAGVLYPSFGLLLSPMIAAAAMSFSSVSVIANALRLRSARV
jgi:cation transport ATPase